MPKLNGVAPKEKFERDTDGAIWFNTARVKPFQDNPRKIFRRIPELAESIRISGQRQPGEVKLLENDPDYDAELIDGERRLRACRQLGIKFRAYPKHDIGDKEDQFEKSFISNFGREDHDCIEIARSIGRILSNKGRSLKEIAAMAGKSITWAVQHHNLLKLHPEIQQSLIPAVNEEQDSERVMNFSLAQLLVEKPHDFQLKAAHGITKGKMGLLKARRYILQLARQTGTPIKERRYKPLARFNSLVTLSENLRDSLGVFLDMKDSELNEMLRGADPLSKDRLVEKLEGFAGDLGDLIEVLKKKSKTPIQTVKEPEKKVIPLERRSLHEGLAKAASSPRVKTNPVPAVVVRPPITTPLNGARIDASNTQPTKPPTVSYSSFPSKKSVRMPIESHITLQCVCGQCGGIFPVTSSEQDRLRDARDKTKMKIRCTSCGGNEEMLTKAGV